MDNVLAFLILSFFKLNFKSENKLEWVTNTKIEDSFINIKIIALSF